MQTFNAALAERIGVAAVGNPYLNGQQISVDDVSQRVVLRGVVSSYYEKQMAQETLLRVDGVEAVENHLEVMRRRARSSDTR